MRYQGIIFDMDGTLVDSFEALHGSLTEAMRRVGVPPWDLEATKAHVGRGNEYLVESAVGPERRDEALRIFREDYAKTCLGRTRLLPFVGDVLPILRARGLRLAVATNKPLVFTRRILDHLGVDRYFDQIFGPGGSIRPKPEPDMIQAILKGLGLEGRKCLYVGDMPLDVETAGRAGLACLLVATGPYPYAVLRREVPVPVLRGLNELVPFLDDLEAEKKSPGKP